MVDPAGQGRGVGRALGVYAVDWARAAGYRSMQFNAVVETNTSAVRLWQSLGFEILTTVPEAFDHPRHGLVGPARDVPAPLAHPRHAVVSEVACGYLPGPLRTQRRSVGGYPSSWFVLTCSVASTV